MKRHFLNSAIVLFFCFMMGAIIMADCFMAVGYTVKQRGIAGKFSDYTIRFTILQAQAPDSFLQSELENFLNESQANTTIMAKDITSQNGVELYVRQGDYFNTYKEQSGVWLSQKKYHSWEKENISSFFYKNYDYTVLGSYKENLNKDFVLDMKGELRQNPEEAMYGTYYLDCKENTADIYNQLVAAIQTKNPYAQIFLEEEQADGYLFARLMRTEDAMYYLIQMGLLLFLNILNFGNIVGYWANARRRELFVRRLTGGTTAGVFQDMIFAFMGVVVTSVLAGCITGGILSTYFAPVTREAIFMGIGISVIQCLLLLFLGSIVLYKNIRISIIELKKEQ